MAFLVDFYAGPVPTAARRFVGVFRLPAMVLNWWLRRSELARSRQALLSLDDRILADVGLDRATARAEGEKGFWG